MKTGNLMEKNEKRERKRKGEKAGTGYKKYKKGERLKELKAQVAADVALIEEAERLAVAPNAGEFLKDGEACDQITSIRQAFDTEHLKGFNKDDFKLFSVRAEEWGPLVFVNLDDDDIDSRITKKSLKDISDENLKKKFIEDVMSGSISEDHFVDNYENNNKKVSLMREKSHGVSTPSLLQCLGGVVKELETYPLSELVCVRSSVETPKANWKLLQENFMEYYHLPSVHPNLCHVSGVDEHKRRQGKGQYVGFVTEPLSSGGTPIDPGLLPEFPGIDESQKSTAVFHSLFPNVFYFLMPSHAFIVRLEPISPTETREYASLMVHPSLLDDGTATDSVTGKKLSSQEIEKRIDAIWDFYLETNDEDIVACELVQEGIQIESYQGGRMSFRFEETIHRFQNMLAVSFYVFLSFFFQSFLQNFF
jgi:phenylpropionate dioxygenase-like ring-hydroxylating dioxygenase large terminal subunit